LGPFSLQADFLTYRDDDASLHAFDSIALPGGYPNLLPKGDTAVPRKALAATLNGLSKPSGARFRSRWARSHNPNSALAAGSNSFIAKVVTARAE
jgi:hypothetical protein